jgi:hypothetical protein
MYENGNDDALLLEEVQREIEGKELENSVFEAYLRRNDNPRFESADSGPQDRLRIQNGRQSSKQYAPVDLTITQKCDVAGEHLECRKREMEDSKKSAEKLADTLKAVLEETETRISELKKDAYEFKRDVVVGGENMRTGRVAAEKVTKYMEDKLKARDLMIDKLKLKNGTLKANVAHLEAELKAKDETGDVLHYIDFHQLQIENKQFLTKIEGLNAEVFKLKSSCGVAVNALNAHKSKLSALITGEEECRRETAARKSLCVKLRAAVDQVCASIEAERRSAKRLVQDTAGSATGNEGAPQVLDYVAQKAEMFELQQVLKTWERKVELMEMAAKRTRALKKRNATSRA